MKSWKLTNACVGPLKTVLEAVERTQIYSVTESIVHDKLKPEKKYAN